MITIRKKWLLFIIIAIIGLIIYLNISMVEDLNNLKNILSSGNQPVENPDLDIALIYLKDSNNSQELVDGARTAAHTSRVNLKTFSVKPSDQINLQDYFQLSLMANYDGIIVEGNNPGLVELINRAADTKIPTVTIRSDLPNSRRISYVGINNHRAGFIIGRKMLENLSADKPRLAVVSTDYRDDGQTPTSEHLKIFGFKEAISSHPEAELVTWVRTRENILDSLQTISRLLSTYPMLNGIFTTQTPATLAAANALENQNPEQIYLIGYGDTPEIRGFINRGIISASVIKNPRLIGENAVKEITTYLRESKVNLYSNISIQLLTGDAYERD